MDLYGVCMDFRCVFLFFGGFFGGFMQIHRVLYGLKEDACFLLCMIVVWCFVGDDL